MLINSRGSQNAKRVTADRNEIAVVTLKQPAWSAKYAGKIRPGIEPALEVINPISLHTAMRIKFGDHTS